MSTAVYLYCPICDKSSGSIDRGADFFSRLLRSLAEIRLFALSPVYNDLDVQPILSYYHDRDDDYGPVDFMLEHSEHSLQIKDEYGHLYYPQTGNRVPDKGQP